MTVDPPKKSESVGRLRLEFIDPLFAIAIHIGVAEGILHSPWFEQTRLPVGQNEWFNLGVFCLGFATLVLSWFGYHASLRIRPLQGQGRFIIDVVLVLLYAVMLAKYDHFSAVLFVLMIVFWLYPVWDILKVLEHPRLSRTSGYRREIVSGMFALIFSSIWALERWSVVSGGVILVLAFVSVIAYRAMKAQSLAQHFGMVGPVAAVDDRDD
jgi:uncharacterized membrane protein